MKSFFYLILLLISLPTWSQERDCNHWLVRTLTLKVKNADNETMVAKELQGEQLTRFEKYLEEKGLKSENLTPTARGKEYLKSVEKEIMKYSDEDFMAFQRKESLKTYLLLRGHKMNSNETPREALVRQSALNVERALQGKTASRGLSEFAEEESHIDKFQFFYKHNSTILSKNSDTPIISSRRIEDILGTGGLNSRRRFNKTILQSDDSVFFVPRMSLSGNPKVDANNYGAYAVFLNREYAQANGMISSFVMYEHELLEWAAIHEKQILDQMVYATQLFYSKLSRADQKAFKELLSIEGFGAVYLNRFSLVDIYKKLQRVEPEVSANYPAVFHQWHDELAPELKYLRGQLYKTDYTVEDFESTFKEILLQEVQASKKKLPQNEFEKEMITLFEVLESGKWDQSKVIKQTVLRMGFSPKDVVPMELTIQASVPGNMIRILGN